MTAPLPATGNPVRGKRAWGRVAGVGLIVVSTLLYLSLIAVPWLPLTGEVKLALGSALVVAGEASFWIGGLLVGREVVQKYRPRLNPLRWWRRKR